MILVLVILAVLAVGLCAAALVLRTGVPGVADPVTSESFEPLDRGGVRPDTLIELRFDQAVRGYRMSQVDSVLDQLAEELRDRDHEIASLRAELADVPVDFTGRGAEGEPARGDV
ncbi:DivIVA domain-containing protein [Ornithinimicrobium cryptoxanthini]|uniref:DivIVA domain-containing protein n=1 Tax=Ornithinimicrobium cryptoxanthini TaxID=2934161 RepID=UPI002117F076|nr:DivIVA domain-containing protein [Ornithinimicrobium cryptoxanthini]